VPNLDREITLNFSGGFLNSFLPAGMFKFYELLPSAGRFGSYEIELALKES
jgi:hypothetical protein